VLKLLSGLYTLVLPSPLCCVPNSAAPWSTAKLVAYAAPYLGGSESTVQSHVCCCAHGRVEFVVPECVKKLLVCCRVCARQKRGENVTGTWHAPGYSGQVMGAAGAVVFPPAKHAAANAPLSEKVWSA
jgi:hypothetical protein